MDNIELLTHTEEAVFRKSIAMIQGASYDRFTAIMTQARVLSTTDRLSVPHLPFQR